MRLSLIERYFFGKAIVSVSMAAAALVGVMWIVRAVQEVDIIMNKGQGILTYLSMISLGVPTLAAAIAPLALLIGLVRTINGLNDDSELVVMHASGASRIALMKPFLATGAIVAIVVFVLQVWVAPNSMASLRGYMTDVRADLVSLIVREGTFNDVGEGMTFHVASRAPGGVLKGVFIQDARGEDEVQTYLAETGIVTKVGDNAFLILDNGQIQRQPRSSEQVSTIRFESYAFRLVHLRLRQGRKRAAARWRCRRPSCSSRTRTTSCSSMHRSGIARKCTFACPAGSTLSPSLSRFSFSSAIRYRTGRDSNLS